MSYFHSLIMRGKGNTIHLLGWGRSRRTQLLKPFPSRAQDPDIEKLEFHNHRKKRQNLSQIRQHEIIRHDYTVNLSIHYKRLSWFSMFSVRSQMAFYNNYFVFIHKDSLCNISYTNEFTRWLIVAWSLQQPPWPPLNVSFFSDFFRSNEERSRYHGATSIRGVTSQDSIFNLKIG